MKVVFDREVGEALTAIARYHSSFSAVTARSVKADIDATIKRIARHPAIYVLIGHDDIRRAVTRRYAYVIYFKFVDPGKIAIVSIRGGAQAPLFPRS